MAREEPCCRRALAGALRRQEDLLPQLRRDRVLGLWLVQREDRRRAVLLLRRGKVADFAAPDRVAARYIHPAVAFGQCVGVLELQVHGGHREGLFEREP